MKLSCLNDLALIDRADPVVDHETRLIRPICPRLLVVHDVRDLIIVRSRTILLYMIAPR